jgi:hypothetical protein
VARASPPDSEARKKAVQLALLRFPGIALQADETPPQELIHFLALQLNN